MVKISQDSTQKQKLQNGIEILEQMKDKKDTNDSPDRDKNEEQKDIPQ